MLLLQGLSLHAQVPVHFTADKSPDVPFSFRYGGKGSHKLLRHGQSTMEPAGDVNLARWTWTGKDGLQVVADVRTLSGFPQAVDYVLRFRNTGSKDTKIIEDILPLDLQVPALPGPVVVHHARGSDAAARDFEPLEEQIAPGETAKLASSDGRSSSGASLPFFNVENDGQGMIAAVGWSGNWKADIAEAEDGKSLHISAGMQHTHLRLRAGEEIRTPRIVLLRWSSQANGWTDAQNLWRRLLLANYTPQQNGQPLRGPVMLGSWGGEDIQEKLAFLDWVRSNHLPVDAYAVDAGWFGNAVGSEKDTTSPWWKHRGDWFPSPLYYPSGLRPLGEALQRGGLGFSLWVEPETAILGTSLQREHPDWFLTTDRPLNPDEVLLDLGNPDARRAMTGLLSKLIAEAEVTWLRIDFNIAPARYWELADAKDRVGMHEIQHVTGLYAMLDDLLTTHPGLHIDNCASGGRRLDIEMMSRTYVVWRTDYGYADTNAVQAQTQALAPWVPETSGSEADALSGPWTRPGPYGTAPELYLLRLAYSAGLTVGVGAPHLHNPEWIAHVQEEIAEFREVQPYVYGDVYALQPYTLDDHAWTALQWDRPEHGDGVVVLLRRPHSALSTIPLVLQHIDSGARYSVEIRHTYARTPAHEMSGSTLAGLQVQLGNAPDSALVFYRRVGP